MLDFNNIVTCYYCEHHNFHALNKNRNFVPCDSGFCCFKNAERRGDMEVCIFFKLKQGFHTNKWYPGKNYDWP